MERLFGHADKALLGIVCAEVHAAQDVRLGAHQFVLDEPVTQKLLDFVDGKRERRRQLVRVCGERYAPIDAIFVEVSGGIHGVGEAFVFADFLEESACHAGAHRHVENREGATVAVAHEVAVETQTPEKVRLCYVAFLDYFYALIRLVNVLRGCSVYFLLFELFCTKFYELFVVDFARGADVERNFVGDLAPVLEHLLVRE